MTHLLAIDPGNEQSAWCLVDIETRAPFAFAKEDNDLVLNRIDLLEHAPTYIEMVASYGMPVGAEVFETCVWIGRFVQMRAMSNDGEASTELVYRREVKLHHCHDSRAKDTNIRQALVDRFAPGQPNHGKGTKKEPGWFHGFHSDIWAAYAIGVLAADRNEGYQP